MSTEPTAPRASLRSLLIASVLAALLLYFVYSRIDLDEMLGVLGDIDFRIALVAVVGYSFSFFLRGLRWSVLLRAQEAVSPFLVFWGTCVGYLGNNFLPARAGELLRSAMLARQTSLGASFIFATALTERILDAAWLVLISLLALALIPGLPEWLIGLTRVMFLLGLVGLVGLFAISRLDGLLAGLVARLPLPASRRPAVGAFVERFLLGLRAFQNPSRAVRFLALTVVLWLVDGLAAIVVGRSIGLDLSLPQALLLLAALGLASAAPSTPGYLGVYQFVAVTVMPPFGFTDSQSVAYVILLQGVIYTVTVIWGLPALWWLGVGRRRAVLPAERS